MVGGPTPEGFGNTAENGEECAVFHLIISKSVLLVNMVLEVSTLKLPHNVDLGFNFISHGNRLRSRPRNLSIIQA